MTRYDAWRCGLIGDDGSHPNSPNYDDSREEAIDALLDDPTWVAANKAEADEWADGMLDGDQYSQMQVALADLHDVEPDKLPGSAVLERLYALAKICHGERAKRLRDMATAEVAKRMDAA
jgi:hypothetical protein